MFSSWDLVRPRFWYPMSSLEQSMMELEQMNDLMVRPRFPFGMQRDTPAMATYVEDDMSSDSDSNSDDDDDFFVDLPVVARKCMPTAFQLQVVPEAEPKQDAEEEEGSMSITKRKKTAAAHDKSDTDSSTDMEVDDEGANKKIDAQGGTASTKSKSELAPASTKDNGKKIKRHNKNKKHNNKQLRKHSYKVTPTTERKITPNKPNDASERHTFSSYSFSDSSVVDDKDRRVTTTRRRYEDSTGRLKAVHEREIDGKTLRTTWSRQNKEDEDRHESICSSGSPEEFEALWQQTPFGEAQKKSVKGQLQSESDVEKEVETTTAALKDTNMEGGAAKDAAVQESEKVTMEKAKNKGSREDDNEESVAEE